MLFCSGSAVFSDAQIEIKVMINGEKPIFEQPPIMVNDRVLVPMRAIFEKLGATVEWDGENQIAAAQKGNTVVLLQIGYEYIGVCDDVTKDLEVRKTLLDAPPVLYNDYTFVPVRAVSEAFDANVSWDETDKVVYISYDNPQDVDYDKLITAKHILVTDYNKAEEALNRIRSGEDFDKIMYEYTIDPGTYKNPNGYTFGRGYMVKEFEDAAFALGIGEVSDIVESPYGYHIIKRVE